MGAGARMFISGAGFDPESRQYGLRCREFREINAGRSDERPRQFGRVQTQIDPNKAPTDAAQLEKFQAAQGELSNALSRLLVVVERYPELKANQNFLSLQAQLEGTENRISVERGNFNKTVQDYNVAVRSFPTNLIAGMLGFRRVRFSLRNRVRKSRRQCSLILARLLRRHRRERNFDPGGSASPKTMSKHRRSKPGNYDSAFGKAMPPCRCAHVNLRDQRAAAEVIPPKPVVTSMITLASFLKDAASRFNEQLAQFERETSDQIVVAVSPKIESDEDVAAYTQRMAEGLGRRSRRRAGQSASRSRRGSADDRGRMVGAVHGGELFFLSNNQSKLQLGV